MWKISQPGRSGIWASLLGLVFAGSTLLWVILDRVPPNWDDAWYLTNSLAVYDALIQGGVPGYLAKLNSVFGFKAPLIAALPTPFYLVLGRHWHAAYLVNIAAMWILFAALYVIAKRWWNSRAAVFAVAIAGSMPLLYGLARWYLVEYSLAAVLALAACVLIESDGLQRDRSAMLFGAICGLGLLLKVSFGLFLLPLFLYAGFLHGHRLRPLILSALPCLIIALPWYAGHLRPTLANAFDAGFGAPAAIQGTGPILSARAILTYLSHVAANGISYYFLYLAIVLCLLAAWRRHGIGREWPWLLAWLLPFVVFLFSGNKDVRYIAPVLPAAALVLAWLLDSGLPRTHQGTAVGALLLVFPVVQMFAVSFGVPYKAAQPTYARKFNRGQWPHDEILKLIALNSTLGHGTREMLLMGADRGTFNANNLELAVVASRLPFDVETTAHEKNPDTLRDRLSRCAFFLYKEGGEPESPYFNRYIDELSSSVVNNPQFQNLPYEKRLPDGGMARIYKNLAPGRDPAQGQFFSGTEQPEEFSIDFGGIMALTDFSILTSVDEATVRFRWRCLRPPDREYWCFMHLIDPSRNIVAQRDHRLLGGDPPLAAWRPGNSGEEVIHLRLPAGIAASALRLRFGIYDPPSGQRLRVRPLQPAAASRFSLADEMTALLTAK